MQNQPRLQNCHAVLVLCEEEQGKRLHTQRSLSEKICKRKYKKSVNQADLFSLLLQQTIKLWWCPAINGAVLSVTPRQAFFSFLWSPQWLKYASLCWEQHHGTSTVTGTINAYSYYTATNYTALHVVAADRWLRASNAGVRAGRCSQKSHWLFSEQRAHMKTHLSWWSRCSIYRCGSLLLSTVRNIAPQRLCAY